MQNVPRLPAETVREINAMASAPVKVDLPTLEAVVTNPPAEVVALSTLTERAPETVREAIIKAHDLTACQVELNADQMLEEAKEAHRHAYATAKAIREYGTTEAEAAAKTLNFVREQSRLLKEQGERLNQFISGATAA